VLFWLALVNGVMVEVMVKVMCEREEENNHRPVNVATRGGLPRYTAE
jgi:hypothetical protein